ncbi:hypothetical protein ACFWIO_02255 [Streptomyces diastatochromogenes]|uniref:hypothetical protein n=1 Tax=Streptomyces diastatochromogenes TaxID=42236 RepID=UPI003664627D
MTRKRMYRPTTLGAAAALGLSLAVLPLAPAHAVTFVPCGNVTALRNAITQSNTTDEDITLAPFCTYTVTTSVGANNGLPAVTGSYSINGYNTTIARSTASGTPTFRLFTVESGGDLTLNSLSVRFGNVPGDSGGGVLVTGGGSTLTVNNGSVRDNSAGTGGGIRLRTGASATLSNAVVSGNTATGSGGGISHAGASLTVDYSRIQGNTSGLEGGGLRTTAPAVATLSVSQVTGNTANGPLQGGGIYEGTGSTVSVVFTNVSGDTPNNCRPVGAVPGCAN